VGGFNAPDQIEDALASGKCDFVAMGRQQFADPDFVNKTLQGREDEIAPCLRCSCFNPLASDPEKRPIPELWHCAVNPWAGRELRWRNAPRPTGKRRVMVIGGGPAGLYAAATAAQRGHDVILVEACKQLGGLLWFTDVDAHKESLRRFRDCLIARCRRLGVKFQLGTTATKAYIAQMQPDAVICAVGSSPAKPDIPGIEYAHHALFCYDRPNDVGGRVVMIGGGLIGCETGYWLSGTGHQVHVLELRDGLALDANDSHRRALLPRMEKTMTWDCNATVTEITPTGVKFQDRDGQERFVEADTVLYAVGQRPNTQAADALRGACDWFVPVGDCVQARQVKQATYEGFCAAMDIL
jgi:NADPH-dependent 2,4-dienoyl-CoA reductase/sulfur reductase-like enzyme